MAKHTPGSCRVGLGRAGIGRSERFPPNRQELKVEEMDKAELFRGKSAGLRT